MKRSRIPGILCAVALLAAMVPISASGVVPASCSRASLNSAGVEGNSNSTEASISGDGRYVAFTSTSSNLVPDDTNGTLDIFVRDRANPAATTRVSVNSAGGDANGWCQRPAISSDGRYVAFASTATNMMATADANGTAPDVFVRDLAGNSTVLASVNSDEVAADAASAGDGGPSISADGRYVAFESAATNLVPGDNNGQGDIFVRDLVSGTTTRASVSSTGVQADSYSSFPSISADGRYVAFVSLASNLAGEDLNGVFDIYVHDMTTGATACASLSTGGVPASAYWRPSISADGRYVAFSSFAANLVADDTNGRWDVFVRDVTGGATTRASVSSAEAQADNDSYQSYISADGRYVAFDSYASNLADSDTYAGNDIFVRDLSLGTTQLISKSSAGVQGDSSSTRPWISPSGRYVAFQSLATTLVSGDTNGSSDAFVYDFGDAVPPAAPTGLVATAASPTSIDLSWTASTDPSGILKYRVYRADSTFVADVLAPTTTFTVNGLTGGVTYGHYVTAVDTANNESAPSATAQATPPDVTAAAPTGLTATALGTTSIRLTWNASTDISGIAKYKVFKSDNTFVADVTAPTTTYAVGGLTASTAYTFYVKAVDGVGNTSAASATASATTLAAPVTLAPVYRFYNPSAGTHFYTDSLEEANSVIANYSNVFSYEGIAYYTNPSRNTQALYRFYNVRSKSHFYTASLGEANDVIAKYPDVFTYDGPTYMVSPVQVSNSFAVYRFYNVRNGSHFYTASLDEANTVIANYSNVYTFEGPAFWLAQ